MKKGTTDDIIEKLAEKEGVRDSEIREEMKKAILSAYSNSKNRLLWDSLFGKGQLPSPEEFIMKLSSDKRNNISIRRRTFFSKE